MIFEPYFDEMDCFFSSIYEGKCKYMINQRVVDTLRGEIAEIRAAYSVFFGEDVALYFTPFESPDFGNYLPQDS